MFRVASSGLIEGVILVVGADVAPVATEDGVGSWLCRYLIPFLNIYGYELLFSLYLKMKVFTKRNYHTYSLNKHIYNRLIKTC